MLPMLHSQVNDAEVTSEVLYMAVLSLLKKKKNWVDDQSFNWLK